MHRRSNKSSANQTQSRHSETQRDTEGHKEMHGIERHRPDTGRTQGGHKEAQAKQRQTQGGRPDTDEAQMRHLGQAQAKQSQAQPDTARHSETPRATKRCRV